MKCDGQNPCIHCKVYNYQCTYNQPANKKSKSFQQDLQNRAASYECVLKALFPSLDLHKLNACCTTDDDFAKLLKLIRSAKEAPEVKPSSDTALAGSAVLDLEKFSALVNYKLTQEYNEPPPVLAQALTLVLELKDKVDEKTVPIKTEQQNLPPLATSVQASPTMGSPSPGNIGTGTLNIVSKSLDDIAETAKPNNSTAIKNNNNNNNITANSSNDRNTSASSPPVGISDNSPNNDGSTNTVKISLPPLDATLRLVHTACDSAFLFKFYNRLNLIKIIEDFYSTTRLLDLNDQNHNKKLALIYSFLAIGALLENNPNSYNYYNAAYTLLKKKIIETNDVMNIQTLFCLIIFLQCTARLSTCYSFVGIALRSAFRIGLHRKVENINPIDQENRKRLFWSIYKIDVYMNTVLGLPQILDDQIDQDLPLDIEDEHITETGYKVPPMQIGNPKNKKLTTVAIANDHTKLIMILNHIVKFIYPINTDSYYERRKNPNESSRTSASFISALLSKVKLMEQELHDWLENLPIELSPDNTNIPIRFYKPNRLLKLAYLHVQLALYRPFIHLISYKYIQAPNINQDSIKYGMNCINIAIKIVELATEMHEHQLLNGGYWFSIYPIFYSVACLVYYIHENSDTDDTNTMSANVWQITKYAEKGKDVLIDLKGNSMAAARTYSTLNIMFEQLNRRTKKFHTNHQKYFQDTANRTSFSNVLASEFASIANAPSGNSSNTNVNTTMNASAGNVSANNSIGAEFNPNYAALASNFYSPQLPQPQPQPQPQPRQNPDGSILTNPKPSFQLNLDYSDLANANANATTTAGSGTATPTESFSSFPVPRLANNNIDGASNNANINNNSSNNNNENVANVATDQRYYGSMIDKLDMNLFGRFLPPYMLESKSNNSNFTQQMMADPSVGLAGGGLGVGLGNASVDSGIGIGVGTGGAFGANGGDTFVGTPIGDNGVGFGGSGVDANDNNPLGEELLYKNGGGNGNNNNTTNSINDNGNSGNSGSENIANTNGRTSSTGNNGNSSGINNNNTNKIGTPANVNNDGENENGNTNSRNIRE